MVKRIAFYSILVILGLLSFGTRVWWGASQDLRQAEKAFQEKDFFTSVIHYEKVILWNIPFFPFTDKALKGIETVEEQAQKEKNPLLERSAQDALAFALSSIPGLSNRQTELRRAIPMMPRPFWAAVVGIFLLSWIGLTFTIIIFFIDKNLNIKNKAGFILAAGILAAFIFFWIYSISRL